MYPCFLACKNMFSAIRLLFLFFLLDSDIFLKKQNWQHDGSFISTCTGYYTYYVGWKGQSNGVLEKIRKDCWRWIRTTPFSSPRIVASWLQSKKRVLDISFRFLPSWLQQEKDFGYFIPFLIELCIAIIEKKCITDSYYWIDNCICTRDSKT